MKAPLTLDKLTTEQKMNARSEQFMALTLSAIRSELGPAYRDGDRVIVPGWSLGRFRNWLDALDHLATYGDDDGPMRRLLHRANNPDKYRGAK